MAVVKLSEAEQTEPIAGVKVRSMIDEKRGSGAINLGELIIGPHSTLPLHTHPVEEGFFVLDGSGYVLVREERSFVGPGAALLAPAGVPHGFVNESDLPLRLVFMYPAIQVAVNFV